MSIDFKDKHIDIYTYYHQNDICLRLSISHHLLARRNTCLFAFTWFWCYRIYLCHLESLDIFVTVREEYSSVWRTSYQPPEASIVLIKLALRVLTPTFMLLKTKPVTSVVTHGRSATVHWKIYRFLNILSTREVFRNTAIPHQEIYFHYSFWTISKQDRSCARDSDSQNSHRKYHISRIIFHNPRWHFIFS